MTDDDGGAASDSSSGGPARIWLIALALVAAVGLIAALVVTTTSDDDQADDTPDTALTTVDPTTTEPSVTDPPTTPAATAPPTTEPAATEPPATDPPSAGPAFTIRGIKDGEAIPPRFTCDGPNEVPVVAVTSVPPGTQQLALIMDDPDAGDPPFVHWVVYNISPDATEITDGLPNVTYGLNDILLLDWFGPCPPEGDGPHEYVFRLYGLEKDLPLEPGLDGRQLAAAIEGTPHTETLLRATYER